MEVKNALPEGEVYQVEAILDKCYVKGKLYYLIKWVGYDNPIDNSWTLRENCQCPDKIKEFEETRKNGKIYKRSKGRKHISTSHMSKVERDAEADREYVMENIHPSYSDDDIDSENLNDAENKYKCLVEPCVGRVYDFQNGKKVECIIGVKKIENFGFVALFKYEDGEYELAPTSILADFYPRILIAFYEKRTRFCE